MADLSVYQNAKTLGDFMRENETFQIAKQKADEAAEYKKQMLELNRQKSDSLQNNRYFRALFAYANQHPEVAAYLDDELQGSIAVLGNPVDAARDVWLRMNSGVDDLSAEVPMVNAQPQPLPDDGGGLTQAERGVLVGQYSPQEAYNVEIPAGASVGGAPLDPTFNDRLAAEVDMMAGRKPKVGALGVPSTTSAAKQKFDMNRELPEDQVDALARDINEGKMPFSMSDMKTLPGRQVWKRAKELSESGETASFDKNKALIRRQYGPSGVVGRGLVSVSTAMQHLQLIKDYAEAAKSNNWQLLQKAEFALKKQMGNPRQLTLQAVMNFAAGEISKASTGNNNALGDREEIRKAFDASAGSLDQILGVADGYLGLMGGRLLSSKQSYEGSTGLKDFDTYVGLSPAAKRLLQEHQNIENAHEAQTAGADEDKKYFPGFSLLPPEDQQKVRELSRQ
jgi:hypothetical protein